MKRKKGKLAVLLLALGFSACDDGRLYESMIDTPEEGRVAKLTGNLQGLDRWAAGYSVVIAGFSSDSEYAVITKAISVNDAGDTEVVLSGISDEVTGIEFCVVNRLRKRIITFDAIDVEGVDTLRLDVGTINVGMYASLQEGLFNTTCVNCHGASTFAAKGLYLTEGRSYDALVSVPSAIRADSMLVNPGNAKESVLYDALATDLGGTLSRPHYEMVSTQATNWLTFIRDWINDGAKK